MVVAANVGQMRTSTFILHDAARVPSNLRRCARRRRKIVRRDPQPKET